MTDTLIDQDFSYAELSEMSFNDPRFVQDYIETRKAIIDTSQITQDLLDQVDSNTARLDLIQPQVSLNTTDIGVLQTQVSTNTSDLSTHIGASEAHGSNGDIVGKDDLATTTNAGLVKKTPTVNDAAPVAQADATPAPATYDQAQIDGIVDLANANKAAINNAVTQLNDLLSKLRNAGIVTP